jgi:hypothetical protein
MDRSSNELFPKTIADPIRPTGFCEAAGRFFSRGLPDGTLPRRPMELFLPTGGFGILRSLGVPSLRSSFAMTRLHVTIGEGVKMADSGKTRSSRDKVRRHREKLRGQGLRPIQIWVPDVRAPSFAAQAHRQSLAVAESSLAGDDQSFIDSVSDLDRG